MKTCWEHYQCKAKENCPAYPSYGRHCFAVTGTLCHGERQGDYKDKIENCRDCSFYHEVMGLVSSAPPRSE